jgi:hypothetical protein
VAGSERDDEDAYEHLALDSVDASSIGARVAKTGHRLQAAVISATKIARSARASSTKSPLISERALGSTVSDPAPCSRGDNEALNTWRVCSE